MPSRVFAKEHERAAKLSPLGMQSIYAIEELSPASRAAMGAADLAPRRLSGETSRSRPSAELSHRGSCLSADAANVAQRSFAFLLLARALVSRARWFLP
ncbi:hypothetical protein ACH79_06795 [Bradyrhizobium sp. CCBAU 051011]|nr:hypothetical protein ACH79_06795 [Bradyrhizobium sp. CCBAU 051011]